MVEYGIYRSISGARLLTNAVTATEYCIYCRSRWSLFLLNIVSTTGHCWVESSRTMSLQQLSAESKVHRRVYCRPLLGVLQVTTGSTASRLWVY